MYNAVQFKRWVTVRCKELVKQWLLFSPPQLANGMAKCGQSVVPCWCYQPTHPKAALAGKENPWVSWRISTGVGGGVDTVLEKTRKRRRRRRRRGEEISEKMEEEEVWKWKRKTTEKKVSRELKGCLLKEYNSGKSLFTKADDVINGLRTEFDQHPTHMFWSK